MQKREERYRLPSSSGSQPVLLVDAASRRILEANAAASRKYGYPQAELVGLPIKTLWPDAESAWSQSRPGTAAAGSLKIARHRRRSGRPLDVSVEVQEVAKAGRRIVSLAVGEVSERAFSLALMESQSRVLERVARGGRLERVLADLVLAIERLSSGMIGSVLLLSEDGWHLRHGAAPNLPASYWSAIDGLRIGPAAGSCGTAVYSGKQVIVSDIARDPLWRPYRKLALKHGLHACWSTPIFARHRQVLGAFALYYRDVRRPGEREKRLVQVASDLAAIAIERDIADRRLESGKAYPSETSAPFADLARPKRRKLSAREMQICRLIAQGEPVKRIAGELHLTISTVYTHRARIFEKLGVRSNVALTHYAISHRLV